MKKKDVEKYARKREHEQFNSVTQKAEPENQNQTHNTKKEGIQPKNQKR